VTEFIIPTNLSNWRRAVIGGLLSALIVAGVLALQFSVIQGRLGFVGYIAISSATPLLFVFLRLDLPDTGNTTFLLATLTIILWFFIGFCISHFVRKNILAVVVWLSVHALLIMIAVETCLICS